MPKVYLWDSGLVDAPGPRFENLIALHLLKLCHYLEDREGYPVALHYLRDRAGREVDFLVTVDAQPWFAVEAKLSATRVDPALGYFRERLERGEVSGSSSDGRRKPAPQCRGSSDSPFSNDC